jgi:small GTP-binding protein
MNKNTTTEIVIPFYKIIFVGETGVGKTQIIQKFLTGKFINEHLSTVGLDFGRKNIENDEGIYKLQIIDTAGNEELKVPEIKEYYESIDAIIIVFDIQKKDAQKGIKKEREFIKSLNLNNKSYTIIIVGNKTEDKEKRMISVEEGKNFCLEGEHYFEVSAKDGKYINDLFDLTVKSINEKKRDIEKLENDILNKNKSNKNDENKKCCLIY